MEIGVLFETAGESGKPRALAEATLMVDILSLSEHTGRNRVL
jgi:hypothetical protein